MTEKEPHTAIPTLLHFTNSAPRNGRIAWIVLLVGLMITAAATLYMKSSVEMNAENDFTAHYSEIQEQISARLDDHARILQSGVALFSASDLVTRDKWRIFNQQQKVEKNLPGIQGIGFSLLIPRAELTRHIQKIRSEGFPQYKLRPDGDREVYSSIIYLEPFSGRNLKAFGYDMFSEPVRRSAMERARDTDAAALSGKVVLVQETDKEVQAGTLMYAPVYHKGMPIETIEQRRAAISGWVYSPYRMNDLIQGIIGKRNLEQEKQLHLQIFDGTQPSPQSLLYECHPEKDQALLPNVGFTRQIPVDFNGQRWTLRFTQTGGGFSTVDYARVWLTLVGGIIITLLLFFLIRTLLSTNAKAHLIATDLTVELRESEEKHRQMVTNISDVIAIMGIDGILKYKSPNIEKWFGWQPEDLIGTDGWLTVHPDDLERIQKEFFTLLDKDNSVATVEYRYKCKDGSYKWIELTAVNLTNDPMISGVLMNYRDITDSKHAEEELRESEERFTLAIEGTGAGLWDWDMVKDQVVYSAQWKTMLGYEVHEVDDTFSGWKNLWHPDDCANIEKALDDHLAGKTRHYEVIHRLRHKDGGWRWILTRGDIVKDAQGKPCRWVGTNLDITAQKQLEAEKEKLEVKNRQLQKSESLGCMAASIAHHFNNQLGVVIGNLEMAMDELPKGASTHQTLTKAMQSAWTAADMSGLMLTYLGQTHDKRESLDLSYSCRKILPLIETSLPGNVVMETDFPLPRPIIMANVGEIQQILTNLLTNAWEAVGKNSGTISLSVKTVSPAEITTVHRHPIDWQPQGKSYACLEVTDTGCGIEDKAIEQLFDPFFTDKFTGRGMGLPVVLGIVKAYKGVITVDSKPGSGSTFRIFFPVSEEAPRQRQTTENDRDVTISTPAPRKMEEGGTVLVVEDEEPLRKMVAIMLKRLGFTALEAKDGVDALEVFGQHQSEIKLVITDLTMPRMNGWETLTALRKLQPDIPVILASGYDKAHVMSGDHPELPQAFLPKPYNRTALSDAIKQVMESRKK